jgi:tetratricopeptide (TPR) repeat protein
MHRPCLYFHNQIRFSTVVRDQITQRFHPVLRGLTLAAITVATILTTSCSSRPGEKEYENALEQIERSNTARAADLFQKSINKRPGDPVNAFAYHHLGLLAWQEGRAREASAYLENSERLNPHLFAPVYSHAVIARETGDTERARSLFQRAAQLNPTNPRPLEQLALLARSPAEQRQHLQHALQRAPQSARILTALATTETNETASVDRLMQALESDPAYAPALYNLAVIHARDPNLQDSARAYYRSFLDIARDADPARLQQAQAALTARATTTRRPPANPTAQPTTQPTAQPPTTPTPAEPTPAPTSQPPAPEPQAPPQTAPAPPTPAEQLQQARQQAAAGNLDQALACLRVAGRAAQDGDTDLQAQALRTAVELAPDQGRTQLAWGRFLADQNRHAEAIAPLRRVTEREPDWSYGWSALANSALAAEQYDVALNAARRAVDLAPQDPGYLWRLAELYNQTGVRRRARETYQQYLDQFPNSDRAAIAQRRVTELTPAPTTASTDTRTPGFLPQRQLQEAQAAFERGYRFQTQQDWINALYHYDRATQLNPRLQTAFYNKGLVLNERKSYTEARTAFLRSLELRPDHVPSRYNLGLALYEMQRLDEAKDTLRATLQRDPDYAPAHLLLGLIHAGEPGSTRQARYHYTRFLQLQPNHPMSASVRTWLNRQSR